MKPYNPFFILALVVSAFGVGAACGLWASTSGSYSAEQANANQECASRCEAFDTDFSYTTFRKDSVDFFDCYCKDK